MAATKWRQWNSSKRCKQPSLQLAGDAEGQALGVALRVLDHCQHLIQGIKDPQHSGCAGDDPWLINLHPDEKLQPNQDRLAASGWVGGLGLMGVC